MQNTLIDNSNNFRLFLQAQKKDTPPANRYYIITLLQKNVG